MVKDNLNVLCTPTCPNFICLKRALRPGRSDGKPYCIWFKDVCMGANCKYAACRVHALLADKRCNLKIEPKRRPVKRKEDRIDKEVSRLEDKARKLLKRYKAGLEDEFIG